MRRIFFVLAFLVAASAHAECPRIVSQSPYITFALEWMGLGDCIVGASRYDRRGLPDTGGVLDPDVEVISLLEPQLLINAEWIDADKWQAVAPPGARTLRVGGFRSMAEAEAMLRDIGHAADIADIDVRVDRFAADWRAAAARVDGKGRRAVLLSACSGQPYSYGRNTALFDLFSHAGFVVAEDHDTIRQIPAAELAQRLDGVRPDIVFALKSRRDEACSAAMFRPGSRVVPLDEDGLIHPGPAMLDGLEQLRQAMTLQ